MGLTRLELPESGHLREGGMTPQEYCEDRAAKAGSSFYYSFRFLPKEKREAITAFYAFCREVDDVVDECTDEGVARAKVNWWRGEVRSLYEGQASHPVTLAMSPAIDRFALPQEQMQELIDGMEMDLEVNRYRDFKELSLYCYRVASVVGLVAAQIFGYEDHRTQKYAHNLGMAFQLTNIIRDVREDAERGRIYLPEDEMMRFGVSEGDILDFRDSDAFRELMAYQGERALEFYDRALADLPEQDRYNQMPGLVMARIYRTTLDEIARDNWPVMKARIKLTPMRKLWLAWTTAWAEKKRYKKLLREQRG